MFDRAKLGAWIQANHPAAYVPGGAIQLKAAKGENGELLAEIVAWPEELGKPPTPEELAAWAPTPPDPDKAPAPSLEVRDYKGLVAAIDAASTVAGVKAVFRQYLLKRAGL